MGLEFHVSASTTFLSPHKNAIISHKKAIIFSFLLILKKSRNKNLNHCEETLESTAGIDGVIEREPGSRPILIFILYIKLFILLNK